MKTVWVEVDDQGPIRIFKNVKAALDASDDISVLTMRMWRKAAVGQIRHRVWLRTCGNCEMCGETLTEETMHLHERQHRGQFVDGKSGEISLQNSEGICSSCHRQAHANRNPRFGLTGS